MGRRISLRKCIRPLIGDHWSPGHDDDAHVPVLINRSVTENQLAQPGSPARSFDCSVVRSSPQQTLLSLVSAAVEAVGKWKAHLAFQAQRLFHGLSYAAAIG